MRLIPYHSLAEDARMESSRVETEDRLIKEIKNIKDTMENSTLAAYHAIGTKIKGFYGKNYGKDEMGKIAKSIDISRSALYKIVQLAEKYSIEDIEKISVGAFQLSWHRLRDNLSLKREEVLRVYRASHNIAEFNRKIKQLKRGSKSGQESEHGAKDKVTILEGSDQICPGVINFPAQGTNKELSEKIKNLQMEMGRLKSELDEKNRQLESFHRGLTNRKTDLMGDLPEILRDLDYEALMRLEASLFEEIKHRETEEKTLIHISFPHREVQ